jgi:hypothetical protein
MSNPTGWRPTMERGAGPVDSDDTVGAGGAARGIAYEEKLLFERGSAGGRMGVSLPGVSSDLDPLKELPPDLVRGEFAELPALGELEVVRHFTRLSA